MNATDEVSSVVTDLLDINKVGINYYKYSLEQHSLFAALFSIIVHIK